MNKIENIEGKSENFIGIYQINDDKLFEKVIKFYEENKSLHNAGVMGGQKFDPSLKNATEIVISPNDLKDNKYKIFSEYISHLQNCYVAYSNKYPFVKSLGNLKMGRFQIQKYELGGHNKGWHTERDSLNLSQRVFAWMTYLNDVNETGETEFLHFGLKFKPKKGQTLIWPANWTHAHRGNIVEKKEKYILTGWLSF